MKRKIKELIKKIPGTIFLYQKYLAYKNKNRTFSSLQNPVLNPSAIATNTEFLKNYYVSSAKIELQQFFFNTHDIIFPECKNPLVSIILVLYNRAELTYLCLLSILQITSIPYEVIIIDNDSKDETRKFLRRIQNANIVLNDTNVHFLEGSNQAAKLARGEMLLFLNNDAVIQYGALNTAVNVLQSDRKNGAVGGKIFLTDLRLQEAGSIFWNDATCSGYGRSENPFDSEFMFARSVDFCSGAFLLTYASFFHELNGFDERFKPAYYEEADYCISLIKKGFRVVYDPRISIRHFEFASSTSSEKALELQTINRSKFLEKHKDWLLQKLEPQNFKSSLFARMNHTGKKVLYIDERLPHIYYGAGYPRANSIIRVLIELGSFVTIYPIENPDDRTWDDVYKDIPFSCEVMVFGNYSNYGLKEFLQVRKNYYDLIIVSRPTTMSMILDPLKKFKTADGKNIPLIYDAESIFSLKQYSEFNLINTKTLESSQADISHELELCSIADLVISVTEYEGAIMKQRTGKEVRVISHACELNPTEKVFSDRKDLLFMGAVHSLGSPNGDSLFWFLKDIFPLIIAKEPSIKFHFIGLNKSNEIAAFQSENIIFHGFIEDIYEFFNKCKVFLVPTRFASGIPIKALTAASYGLPIVSTSLIQKELNWSDSEILFGDTPIEFASQCLTLYRDEKLWNVIRKNSLAQIEKNHSELRMRTVLQEFLEKGL